MPTSKMRLSIIYDASINGQKKNSAREMNAIRRRIASIRGQKKRTSCLSQNHIFARNLLMINFDFLDGSKADRLAVRIDQITFLKPFSGPASRIFLSNSSFFSPFRLSQLVSVIPKRFHH